MKSYKERGGVGRRRREGREEGNEEWKEEENKKKKGGGGGKFEAGCGCKEKKGGVYVVESEVVCS